MSRRPTPKMFSTDVMDECMGAGESESNKAIKPENHNTIERATQLDEHTANKKALKPENKKALKHVEAKEKATFNLTVEIQERLDDAWMQLRKLHKGTRVTKTLIVEEALRIALDEYDELSSNSRLSSFIRER